MALENTLGFFPEFCCATVAIGPANRHTRAEPLERELHGVSERLATLRDRVYQASFNDKWRAIEELVKSIEGSTGKIDGKKMVVITIT